MTYFSDALSWLAELFGFKPSKVKQTMQRKQMVEAELAIAAGELEKLKSNITKIETYLRKLNADFQAATGAKKGVIGRQIELAFRELDQLRPREEIICGKMNRLTTLLSKIIEGRLATGGGINTEDYDDVAVENQELFGEMKDSDRAAADLARESYEAPKHESVDIDQRVRDLSTSQPTSELSEATLERLKNLESERS